MLISAIFVMYFLKESNLKINIIYDMTRNIFLIYPRFKIDLTSF